jgi:hypothetical protein
MSKHRDHLKGKTMLTRILGLPYCRFVDYSTWREETLPLGESASYGDFHDLTGDATPDDYVMPELLSGGDYAGTTVEKANHRAFLKLYGHHPGVHSVTGGYGTFAVALSIRRLLENPEPAECILDTLEALDNYPVVDDDELSEYEIELTCEGWDCWAKHDYLVGLSKKFGDIEVSDDYAFEIFNRVAARISVDWEADGNDMHIDVDKIVKATTVDDLCTTTTR